MNVSLTPELETLVHEKVGSGLYTSASEVIREGLRLLQERDSVQLHRLEELKREIAIGLEQLERGECIEGEQVFAELRRMSEERRRNQS